MTDPREPDEPEEIAVLERFAAPGASADGPGGANGGRKMRLIRKEKLTTVVASAVKSSLEKYLRGRDVVMKVALEGHLRREMMAGIRAEAREIRGFKKSEFLKELGRSRDLILLQRERARGELRHWLRLSEIYRTSVEGKRSELLERSLDRGRTHDEKLQRKIRDLFVSARQGNLELADLQRRIVDLSLLSTRIERQRMNDERGQQQELESELFKRRIAKLTSSLERTEEAMGQLQSLNESAGVASIRRIVENLEEAGESDHERAQAAKRRTMMEVLFRANVALRGALLRREAAA